MTSEWQTLQVGVPLPFADVPLVAITEVQKKPVKVIDWALVRGHYDEQGKYRRINAAIILLHCDGKVVKVQVACNVMMQKRLAKERGSFYTTIRRAGIGFVFK